MNEIENIKIDTIKLYEAINKLHSLENKIKIIELAFKMGYKSCQENRKETNANF